MKRQSKRKKETLNIRKVSKLRDHMEYGASSSYGTQSFCFSFNKEIIQILTQVILHPPPLCIGLGDLLQPRPAVGMGLLVQETG